MRKARQDLRTLNWAVEQYGVDRRSLKRYLAKVVAPEPNHWTEDQLAEAVKEIKGTKEATAAVGDLKAKKTQEEIRRLKLANDKQEKKLVARAVVCESMSRILGQVLPRIERLLVNEYPAMVAGLDVPGCRDAGRRVYDMIAEAHREFGKELDI